MSILAAYLSRRVLHGQRFKHGQRFVTAGKRALLVPKQLAL